MSALPERAYRRLRTSYLRSRNNRRVYQLAQSVSRVSLLHVKAVKGESASLPQPVAFFNASTRLEGISLNAAFSLLASLGLQMAGVPTVRFACQSGMSRCVLGSVGRDPSQLPPCQPCIAQSRWLYSDAPLIPFTYAADQAFEHQLADLPLERLVELEIPPALNAYQGTTSAPPLPLGQLVLPSIRWVLRRHHLQDDEPTRFLLRQFLLSALQVAREFSRFLDQTDPQAVVLFNGQFFPEAVARWISLQRGLRSITHEVGLLPYSAFFTTGEATAYPLHVPDSFELSASQNERLDAYLSQRFQGQFSMAGIRFWPEIHGLGEALSDRVSQFKQVVPVFTNVIFDTSQPHSNVVFPHMFTWLEQVLELVRQHPETLFILRAHPDEARPGKASAESVSQWLAQQHVEALANLVFIPPDQPLSSYELIHRSRFVMVYNSTIGLEASILGVPVLCAGRARYTQLPTVFFPSTPEAFQLQAEQFLSTAEIRLPPEFLRNARRFLYYQLFRSSLPLADFLEQDGIWPGFVKLKDFPASALSPAASPAIRAIYSGVCEGGDFLLEADI